MYLFDIIGNQLLDCKRTLGGKLDLFFFFLHKIPLRTRDIIGSSTRAHCGLILAIVQNTMQPKVAHVKVQILKIQAHKHPKQGGEGLHFVQFTIPFVH